MVRLLTARVSASLGDGGGRALGLLERYVGRAGVQTLSLNVSSLAGFMAMGHFREHQCALLAVRTML